MIQNTESNPELAAPAERTEAKTNKRRRSRRVRPPLLGLLLIALLSTVLATSASAAEGDPFDFVIQDGEFYFLIDTAQNTRAWAGHCVDELSAIETARGVSFADISSIGQESTPDCNELSQRLSSSQNPVTAPVDNGVETETDNGDSADGAANDSGANLGCPVDALGTECRLDIANTDVANSPGVDSLPLVEVQRFSEGGRDNGGFRTRCVVSHFSYSDPLVNNSLETADHAHLHMFFGNTETNADSTSQSLLANGESTCGDTGQHNRSAYWIPALYNAFDEVVIPSDINAYYKTLNSGEATYLDNNSDGEADVLQAMRTIPNDLKMISNVGNAQVQDVNGQRSLTITVEFLNCIEHTNGVAARPAGLSTDNPVQNANDSGQHRANYEMEKHWSGSSPSCEPGEIRIPTDEFNISWPMNGTTRLGELVNQGGDNENCLLYTSPSPRDS